MSIDLVARRRHDSKRGAMPIRPIIASCSVLTVLISGCGSGSPAAAKGPVTACALVRSYRCGGGRMVRAEWMASKRQPK